MVFKIQIVMMLAIMGTQIAQAMPSPLLGAVIQFAITGLAMVAVLILNPRSNDGEGQEEARSTNP